MMLVVGALALTAALIFPPQIFWLTTFIATIFASSWGPVGLMAIWSKRITEKAAFWGMLTGLVFNVVPKFFEFIGMLELPSYLNPVIIGGVMSLIVTLTVSRRTAVTAEESRYLANLHVRPLDEVGPKRTRTTLIAPVVLLVVNGLLFPVVLTVYYVIPYQRATGMLSADGSLDWATGEMALMMSWSVIWIAVALFAIRYIRTAYSPTRDT